MRGLEQLREWADRLRDLIGALERRLAHPPAGARTIAWVASWMAYAWLALALAALATLRPVPPVILEWLLVVAWLAPGDAHADDEGGGRQRITRHWGGVLVVLLVGCVLAAAGTARPETWAAAWGVALALVVAGAVRREPLLLACWWAGRLAVWSAALLSWWIVWLSLAAAGQAALHPAVAAIDPPERALWDAAVQAAAWVLSAAGALGVLSLLRRAHAAREAR